MSLAFAAGCAGSEPPLERQATCPAPDGRAVATITQRSSSGFGVTQFTDVRVHAPGTPVDSVRGAFATADEIPVNLHVYWRTTRDLVVEYPAVMTVQRLAGSVVLASAGRSDTVWLTPRPVRGMELNASDEASCYPYREGWPQLAPERAGT